MPILLLRRTLGPQQDTVPARFSRAEVNSYYQAHRDRYYTPSQRFIEALVVPTHQLARNVAAQLRRGRPLLALARELKDEGVTRPYTGKLQNTRAAGGIELQRAAQPLGRGDVDMVRQRRGWYVFRVGATLPAMRPSLTEARPQVVQDLQTERYRDAIEAFNTKLRSRYQDRTVCADDIELAECS